MTTYPMQTISGAHRHLDEHAGALCFPGDEGWDEARTPWNLAVDQNPAAVAFPESASDVAAAVRFAKAAGLRVAVQGTGHMASALGDLGRSVLIRTSAMRRVEIDAVARRARVQAGAVWEDVVGPAAAHGLVALHGSSPGVGVVGYSLGGGIGWLARRYGLAASSITAIELVTADGEELRVDALADPELFWGLRGGLANFGIVTALELRLFPLERVYSGWLVWPWEHSREVMNAWSSWTRTVPDTMTSLVRVLRLPSLPVIPEPLRGRDLVVVEAAYAGDDAHGAGLLAPLRAHGPEIDTFAVMPAEGLARLHQDPEGPTPGIGNGGLVDAFTPDAVDAILPLVGPGSASPLVSFEVRHLGGALALPAPGGGALSHLEGEFAYYAVGIAAEPAVRPIVQDRVRRVGEALAPWGSGRAFANFADEQVAASAMFGEDAHRRLRALRDRLDPDRLFLPSQEIAPRDV